MTQYINALINKPLWAIIKKPLRDIGFGGGDKRAYANHLTEERNIQLADNLYKLLKTMDSRLWLQKSMLLKATTVLKKEKKHLEGIIICPMAD